MNTNTKGRAHIEPRKWYTIMLGYGGSESRPFAAVEKTGEMTPSRCYSLFGGPGETMIERPPCAVWRMIDDDGFEKFASDNDLAANGSIGIGTLRPEDDLPPLTDERLAVLVETGKRNEENERKEAEEAKRRSEENQRRIAREYSWLPNKCEDGYMTTAKVAQNVRAHLKHEFPGVKFSVRSEVFSGGNSIRVKYEDGPAWDAVNKIIGLYENSKPDVSGDFRDYDPSDFNRVFGGAKHAYFEREMSEATEAVLYAGITNDNCEARDRRASIHRVFQDTTLPVGAVVTGFKDGKIIFDATKPQKREHAARPSSASAATPCEVSENVERNGVEIRFASIPSEDVRDDLKANGWRWSRFSKCWYNRASDEAREFAQKIAARASA